MLYSILVHLGDFVIHYFLPYLLTSREQLFFFFFNFFHWLFYFYWLTTYPKITIAFRFSLTVPFCIFFIVFPHSAVTPREVTLYPGHPFFRLSYIFSLDPVPFRMTIHCQWIIILKIYIYIYIFSSQWHWKLIQHLPSFIANDFYIPPHCKELLDPTKEVVSLTPHFKQRSCPSILW